MARIRVLVVDDSIMVRRFLGELLGRDPDIEVVGTAANGRLALMKMSLLRPDLIVLDVQMPEMDGIETLRHVRAQHPNVHVLMFTSQSLAGGSAALDALALGASDYILKPTAEEGPLRGVDEQLIPRIRALCLGRRQRSEPAPPLAAASRRRALRQDVQAVVIGISTGGPPVLVQLLGALPADFPVPVLVVQHMPAMFTRLLAERIATQAALPVREGRHGAELEPGQVWIAPGDRHMVVQRQGARVTLQLNQDAQENACRPAVDPLLRSAVATWGANVLAVVMTGMGQDGLRGCEAVRHAGGDIYVQDEASSVVWGMPGVVARAGLADRIVAARDMAGAIVERVRRCPVRA